MHFEKKLVSFEVKNVYRKYITREWYGMYVKEITTHWDKNGSGLRRRNPHTTEQAEVGPKTSLFPGTAKELPFFTQVLYE